MKNVRMSVSVLAATAAFFATGVAAKVPAGLSDLVGMRGSSLENAMTGKGYTFVKAAGPQYWWSVPDKTCAIVSISQGKVSRIATGTPAQCGKKAAAAPAKPQASGGQASAVKACTTAFGPGKVGTVSALKPGFWEVMLSDNNGRKVACTGNAKGTVEEWNELGK